MVEDNMKRIGSYAATIGTLLLALISVVGFTGTARAQSGHFVGVPICTDIGTQVQCTGKVAGLGGTTFTVEVVAPGTGSIECENPAGNVAPGQSFTTTVGGSTGPIPTPAPGQFTFRLSTVAPTAPARSCPNQKWTATVIDVTFADATLRLLEDGVLSDTITVPVQ
jgi:hypothetical protein